MEENIYADVDDLWLTREYKKLKQVNNDLESQIVRLNRDVERLCQEMLDMKKTQHNLTENISSLYKTAKLEMERKDRMIADLRRQLEDYIFKRKGPRTPSTPSNRSNSESRSVLEEGELDDSTTIENESENFTKNEAMAFKRREEEVKSAGEERVPDAQHRIRDYRIERNTHRRNDRFPRHRGGYQGGRGGRYQKRPRTPSPRRYSPKRRKHSPSRNCTDERKRFSVEKDRPNSHAPPRNVGDDRRKHYDEREPHRPQKGPENDRKDTRSHPLKHETIVETTPLNMRMYPTKHEGIVDLSTNSRPKHENVVEPVRSYPMKPDSIVEPTTSNTRPYSFKADSILEAALKNELDCQNKDSDETERDSLSLSIVEDGEAKAEPMNTSNVKSDTSSPGSARAKRKRWLMTWE